MCNLHHRTVPQVPTQKFGYLDIKQSSNVRPRKLKSWRRRWAVLTKMSNLTSDEYVAKLDLYVSESKWRNNSFDKLTFVLENVSRIQNTTSRTHEHAFEVVESQPVLVMSGATELESYSWILALRQIFTPEDIETTKDCYMVTVLPNEHASIWNLSGQFTMSVTSTCISLADPDGSCVLSWALSTLIRFSVEKDPVTGEMTVLVIESGPNSPTGQSSFHFLSTDAQDIMCAIRQSICLAQSQKQQSFGVISPLQRKLTSSVSENSIPNLPDNHSVFPSFVRNRTDSGNNSSSINYRLANSTKGFSNSPVPSLKRNPLSAGLGLLIESAEDTQDCNSQLNSKDMKTKDIATENDIEGFNHIRSSLCLDKSLENKSGYSEIKDVETDTSRTNSCPCELPELNFKRLRSISAVVASIEACKVPKHERSISFKDDTDTSDIDSAISSMKMSAANDELPWRDSLDSNDYTNGNFLIHQDRKKSRSTPNLHASWKRDKDGQRFENVYEELDELGTSMKRFSQKQGADTPPELPERPLSMSFTSPTNCNLKTSLREEGTILSRHEKYNETKARRLFICNNPNNGTYRSVSAPSTVFNRHSFIHRTKSRATSTANKEDLFDSSYLWVNEINNIAIPELQLAMFQESSNNTHATTSSREYTTDSCSGYSTDLVTITKSSSLTSYEKDSKGLVNHKSLTEKSLITDTKIKNNVKSPTLLSDPRSATCSSSNPLISFFIDDVNFQSNPMVTGELPAFPSSLSSARDLLMDDSDMSIGCIPLLPFTVSSCADLASNSHPINTAYYTNTKTSSSTKSGNPFDIWSVDSENCQVINENILVPSFISRPFHGDPFAWSQGRPDCISQTRTIQGIESSYMTMLIKPGSSYNELNKLDGNMTDKFNFVVDEIKYSEKQTDGIYIQPTNIS